MKSLSLIPVLVACLISCTRPTHWSCAQIQSENKNLNSSKLVYVTPDPVHGIDLEFLFSQNKIKAYLNVHSLPIPASKEDSQSAKVRIWIDGNPFSFHAYRLAGGQRLLLNESTTQTLIEALKENKRITIALPGYKTSIPSEDFNKKFHRFLHPSSPLIPIKDL